MVVVETLQGLGQSVVTFLPQILIAVVLLLIGWLLGWVANRVSKKILEWVKIDSYISQGGKKPHFSLTKILPVIISWGVYLVFIRAAVEALGINTLTSAVSAILHFLPGLVGAILVIVAGYAIGEYVRRHIEESKVSYSDLIGKGMFFLVLYIAVATALPLISIDASLINNILLVIIGSVGAGAAIALGLGLQDTVREMAHDYRKSSKSGGRKRR